MEKWELTAFSSLFFPSSPVCHLRTSRCLSPSPWAAPVLCPTRTQGVPSCPRLWQPAPRWRTQACSLRLRLRCTETCPLAPLRDHRAPAVRVRGGVCSASSWTERGETRLLTWAVPNAAALNFIVSVSKSQCRTTGSVREYFPWQTAVALAPRQGRWGRTDHLPPTTFLVLGKTHLTGRTWIRASWGKI